MRTCLQMPLSMSQMRSVVSLDPEMAVFSSDIFKHLTVDVCPRRVWTAALIEISQYSNQGTPAPQECERDRDLPSGHIPDPYVAIAAATHKQVSPRHHGPDAHDVALQRLLVLALRVENVDLRVVKRDNNVLVGEV